MQNDFDDSLEPSADIAHPPALRALRLVSMDPPDLPERRRSPRRQVVAGCASERRRTDRRKRRPGVDGLLRMVLSDSWR